MANKKKKLRRDTTKREKAEKSSPSKKAKVKRANQMAKQKKKQKTPAQNEKIEEALRILASIGIPVADMPARRKERIALALLAAASLKPDTPWKDAACWEGRGSWALGTREIIKFWNEHYNEDVSSGSYDDVRRKDLIYLVESELVQKSTSNPDASTNDPSRRYAINPATIDVLRTFGRPIKWQKIVDAFKVAKGSLEDRMERRRQQKKVPVTLPSGKKLELSFGPHNDLQKAIIEEFLPRYGKGAEVLYVGDTSKKSLLLVEERLKELAFFELAHDALPDVVAYDPADNRLFLIEAVHSFGPMSKLRHIALERMTKDCTATRIYVSAFKDRAALREWLLEISWETEVWLVESPDHVIHFNGDKYLSSYAQANA